MKRAVVFQAPREGYGIDQIAGNAITVGDLVEWLQENCEGDEIFVLSHDSGYTYGSIDRWTAELYTEGKDGEFTTDENGGW